jgi:Cu+-exporting ATPase
MMSRNQHNPPASMDASEESHEHLDHEHHGHGARHQCCHSGHGAAAPIDPAHVPEGTIWTCPMHPQIRQDHPGNCPICGMALEPLEPSLEEGPNPELIDMTRRFWISAVLSIPLIVLTLG